MDREDAVRLVERVLRESSGLGDAERKAVENLVDSVQCHARSLVLLAPSIETDGVERTQELLAVLTARMHRQFPHSREQSLFASVELSLRRLSPERRNQAQALAVFHGLVDLDLLGQMMEWTRKEALVLGDELTAVGLATALPYHHLRLDPALCPYLRSGLQPQERDGFEKRWAMAMQELIFTLYETHLSRRELVNTLTTWELPNFVALLNHMDKTGEAETTVQLCTRLSTLVAFLGKSHLLKQIDQIQERASSRLAGNWSHAHFEAKYMLTVAALGAMHLEQANELAGDLYRKAISAGELAYINADYDIAMAAANWSQVRHAEGFFDEALALLDEASQRFQKINKKTPGLGLEGLANALTNQGIILIDLGRFTEAITALREALALSERGDYKKNIAQIKINLAKGLNGQNQHIKMFAVQKESRAEQELTWLIQNDEATSYIKKEKSKTLTEILRLLEDALDISLQIGEPDIAVQAWYGIGQAYSNANKYNVASNSEKFDAAEHAYREALKTAVQNNLSTGFILIELGNIYNLQQRWEEAREVYQQSSIEYHKIGDSGKEGIALSNLANAFYKLGDYSQARSVVKQALDLIEDHGDAAKPWYTWAILQDIETADGRSLEASFANNKAFESYLAYRRQGGETHTMVAAICAKALDMIKADQAGGLMMFLNYLRDQPTWQEQGGQALLDVLEAIAGGSRDKALAENPSLMFVRAVEIVLLLEKLPLDKKNSPTKKNFLSTFFSRIIGRSQNSFTPIVGADTKLRSTRIFQQREIITPVPAGWVFEEQADFGTRTVTVTHQSNEVKVLASFFPDPMGKMATRKELEDFCRLRWEQHPERKSAVEKSMDIKFFEGKDGIAVWHSYTDSTLVGREIPSDQWLYETIGLRSWNGAFVGFTILSNSRDSFEYRQALELVLQGIFESPNLVS
jgi:tetratricopeptide (TPR) repeat protein